MTVAVGRILCYLYTPVLRMGVSNIVSKIKEAAERHAQQGSQLVNLYDEARRVAERGEEERIDPGNKRTYEVSAVRKMDDDGVEHRVFMYKHDLNRTRHAEGTQGDVTFEFIPPGGERNTLACIKQIVRRDTVTPDGSTIRGRKWQPTDVMTRLDVGIVSEVLGLFRE